MSTAPHAPVSTDDIPDESALCIEISRLELTRDQRLSLGRRLNTMRKARNRIAVVVTLLIIAIVVRTFLFGTYSIPSTSMEDTLTAGDTFGVSRLAPSFVPLAHGDIVVFTDPGGWSAADPSTVRTADDPWWISALTMFGVLPVDASDHLIKRVIGLPGDHVVCCDVAGHVTVNGQALTETYTKLPPGVTAQSATPFDVFVPAGSLWVMGDNRYASDDSRAHMTTANNGFVDLSDVTGRALLILWPVAHMAELRQVPDQGIPAPGSTPGPVPVPEVAPAQ